MGIEGWYYLHTNGSLIYKRDLDDTVADIRESDFAVALWPVDPSDRECAWTLLIEAWAANAEKSKVTELAEKWGCTDEDAAMLAKRLNLRLFKDGSAWCATRFDFVDLQASPVGFGDTCLEAMAELCKELGYRPSKMWGSSFRKLIS
jgi:hypothetical protein